MGGREGGGGGSDSCYTRGRTMWARWGCGGTAERRTGEGPVERLGTVTVPNRSRVTVPNRYLVVFSGNKPTAHRKRKTVHTAVGSGRHGDTS